MAGSESNGSAGLSCHALIIGCGLSGIATAIALASSGHAATVFERMPELREIGAGIQLSPNATRLFRRWKIYEPILKIANQPQEGTIRSYRGKVLSRQADAAAIEAKYGSLYLVVHRADLLRILESRARELGVQIVLGLGVSSISFNNPKPSLRLSNGEVRHGDFIFGADGERSLCRDVLSGCPNPLLGTGDIVYRTAVKRSNIENSGTRGSSRNDQQAKCEYLDGPQCTCGSDEKDHEVMLGPQTAEIEEVRKAYSGWDPMLRALLDIPGSEFTKWSLLKTDDVAEWSHQDAKIILIGDAAHAMPPYLAQGAAQAFEDAAVLGVLFSKIKRRSQIVEVLETYTKIWRPRVLEVKRRTEAQKQMYGLCDSPLQERRDRELTRAVPDQDWLWGYDAVLDAEDS